jgi:hypothetical protein
MADLESKCDALWSSFGDLPGLYPKEYSIWYASHKKEYSSRIIVNKSGKSAKEIWNGLIVNYFKFPEVELSKSKVFISKLWHNIFARSYSIIDKENNRRTTARIPWYSFFLRPFFGGHIILTKIEENYCPQQPVEETHSPVLKSNELSYQLVN